MRMEETHVLIEIFIARTEINHFWKVGKAEMRVSKI